MQKTKSLKVNMLMSVILTAANFIFPMLTYSYAARIFTPAGMGKITFVSSTLSYFSLIATLGIPAYGLKECAKVRDDREKLSQTVQELLVVGLASTLIAYAALAAAVMFVPKLREHRSLFAVMSLNILLSSIGVEWLYQAMEEYTYITVRSIAFKLVSVALIFLLIRAPEHLVAYGFLTIVAMGFSNLWNFIHAHRFINLRPRRPLNYRRHLKPVLTLFAARIAATVYNNFDVLLMGFVSSDEMIGLYGAATKIRYIVMSVSTSIAGIMVPRLSYYIQQKKQAQVEELLIKSMRAVLLTTLPLAGYIFVHAENVLLFVCGNDYVGAADVLRIFMVCVVPLILTCLFGEQILIPYGRENRYSQSVFWGMWINLGLNILLIPRMGIFGAGIAITITEIWNFVWMSGGVKELRKTIFTQIRYGRYFVVLILALVGSGITGSRIGDWNVFWQLALTASVFFGVYYSVLLLMREPLIAGQVQSVLNRLRRWNKEA